MPRPRAPLDLPREFPISLDESLKRLFQENGLEFANAIKQSKVQMRVMFQMSNGSYWHIEAEVPLSWKSIVEHDDIFYDAIVRSLKEWLMMRRERGFMLMARSMAALIPKDATTVSSDYDRAAGGAVCSKCGLEFVEHPTGMLEFLHLICDGKQVKL